MFQNADFFKDRSPGLSPLRLVHTLVAEKLIKQAGAELCQAQDKLC